MDVADDRLPALMNDNPLDPNHLRPLAPLPIQRVHHVPYRHAPGSPVPYSKARRSAFVSRRSSANKRRNSIISAV